MLSQWPWNSFTSLQIFLLSILRKKCAKTAHIPGRFASSRTSSAVDPLMSIVFSLANELYLDYILLIVRFKFYICFLLFIQRWQPAYNALSSCKNNSVLPRADVNAAPIRKLYSHHHTTTGVGLLATAADTDHKYVRRRFKIVNGFRDWRKFVKRSGTRWVA